MKFLEEIDSDHQDLDYRSHVRWLSLGKACKRVWERKKAIIAFLKSIGKADDFSELEGRNLLGDFSFSVDILTHMNELNAKLQGKELYAHYVMAFKSKLALFSAQMSNNSFHAFSHSILTMKQAPKHANKHSKSLNGLHHEFCRGFLDFKKLQKIFQFISATLSHVAATALEGLQLKLMDPQSDILKEKFKTLKLNEFYPSLSHTRFPKIRKMAQKMLVLFGSTCVCEQPFSQMNFNKSNHKSQLSDAHLKSVLTIATNKMIPNFDALARNKT